MVTPPKRWALALSAVLTEQNHGFHHELGMWGVGEHTAAWCRHTLGTAWGVNDAASFRSTADWLWTEGQSAEVLRTLATLAPDARRDDDKVALVRANRALLDGRGLLAWDMGRYVAVVGWGRWAGYIEEPEAWRKVHAAAIRVQGRFKHWREYGRHYEFGRYYSTQEDDPRSEAILAALQKDPASPWVELAWNLPLGPGPG